jgi:tetratricopeptide (TPR) repeat protein
VTYFRQAGEKALLHSAYREAVAAFEQALEAVQQLPENRATLTQAIDLRLALHKAIWPLGELGRVLVSLQEAEVLAETLGDPHRLGWVAAGLSGHFGQICALDQALASGQRALAIAMDLGEMGLTVTARHYLGFAYRSLGNYPQAIECFQKNVACLHGALLQECFGLPGLASVLSRCNLIVSLAECGDFAEGRAPAEEAVRMAEDVDHPYSRVIAYWTVGFQALRQGNLSQALPVLERSLTLAQETHIRLFVPRVASTFGVVCALAGRAADALPLLEQAVEQTVAMRFMAEHALRVVWLGEAYLRAGRLDEADTQAQRALEFARAHRERGYAAEALRLLGEIAVQRQPPEIAQAEAYYRQALAEDLGMRLLQAHCHRGFGTLYLTLGQGEQARAALSAAIALYRTMNMTFWLPQAEAALAQAKEERQRG